MSLFQTTGYKSKSLVSDIALGIFDGIDNGLWCYAFAAIIFAGALSAYMPLLVVIMLSGWAVLGVYIATTSQAPVHVIHVDEQGTVILSTIGVLLVTHLGTDVAASGIGASTMLAVISATTLTVALGLFLVGHYHLTRLLELLPYPVICGFMAGVGWLLLQAGFSVAVHSPISLDLLQALQDPQNILRLGITLAGGAFLMLAADRINKAWALPAAAVIILAIFFVSTNMLGYSKADLVAENWLFDIRTEEGGALDLLGSLSFRQIDTDFIISVVPQIMTIAFLALLSASMCLSAVLAASQQDMNTAREMQNMGRGNALLGLMACPAGYTDVTGTVLYSEFGASSRWMPITGSAVCVAIAMMGTLLISWMPTILVGSVIFLFAFQMLQHWMYENVRGFQPIDYAIVIIILGTVIFVGFMPGILAGVLLALLLFVLRYSMISAVHGNYSLADYRSSVERAPSSNLVLDEYGDQALVYTLRGFLFFGTANAILDTIRDDSGIKQGNFKMVLLDLKRVTGIDISALNTFVLIKRICESCGVKLLYSGIPAGTEQSIVMLEAVSMEQGKPLIFKGADYAVEYMENLILQEHESGAVHKSISQYLLELFEDEGKVNILLAAMERIEYPVGQTLFHQGDDDTGLYMLESGSMTALIKTEINGMRRVKKFNAGSLIGEMSSYTADRKRTATIISNEPSVLYYLSVDKITRFDKENAQLASSIHELVARTLGMRITYMNRRLIQELR
jgi:SulP family sulfate permease